jgi:hypothetical protein
MILKDMKLSTTLESESYLKIAFREMAIERKNESRMGQTGFFIYSGIYLQLTTRKSDRNS